MDARTTWTLSPLHFEDLEPQRFEDLVRQLAYQFRSWRVIEAAGRLDADAGMDISAIESPGSDLEPTGEENEYAPAPPSSDRLWALRQHRSQHAPIAGRRATTRETVRGILQPDPVRQRHRQCFTNNKLAGREPEIFAARDRKLTEARERGKTRRAATPVQTVALSQGSAYDSE